MENLQIPVKQTGEYLTAQELNAIVNKMNELIIFLGQLGILAEYIVPYGQINGVADDLGVIIGAAIFDLPANVDLGKPVLCFVNGTKVPVQTSVVVDQKRITLPVAPLGDSTIDGSSIVSVLYYSL